MPIELYPNIAKVKRNGVYQNLPGFVQASSDSDIKAMIATSETSTTAQFEHVAGSYFILNDVLYQADENIAVNDIIAVGTNCHVEILGNDVEANTKNISDLNGYINERTVQTDLSQKLVNFTSAYITSGGVITNSTSWDAFILFVDEISDYDSVVFSGYFASSGRKQVAFYSSKVPSNDTYISGIAFISGEQPSVITLDIDDIPNNAKAILVTNLKTGGSASAVGIKETNNIEEADNGVDKLTIESENNLKAKFDNRFNYICYSDNGASGGIAVNTEEMYTWAGTHDFVSIKGDVRITSDKKLIMCHDAGFTLDGDGYITYYDPSNNTKIANMTYDECIALTYPNGEHVCGIDALIRTCKIYGKIAYVTLRDGDVFTIAQKLFESLDKYNMRNNTIINSFTYDTLRACRKYDENIMLSWVQTANHVVTTSEVDSAELLGNVCICGYDYGNGAPTGIANQSTEVIAYAKQKGIRFYEAIVTNDTSLNQLYDNGVMGAQIEYMPSCLVY